MTVFDYFFHFFIILPFFFYYLLQVDRSKKGIDKLTEYAFGFEFVRNFVFKKAHQQVMKMSNGLYPAPLKVGLFRCFSSF